VGLDIYVGTLTRYYAREWQTILQQAAPELGVEVRVVRPTQAEDTITDPAELEQVVTAWRDQLAGGLRKHVAVPVVWNEGMDAPYFTDKPAWDCYAALMIWAAHEEHRDIELPQVAPDDWSEHPAVARSQATDFKSRYKQLLNGPELWLPVDFDFTFRTEDAAGVSVEIGSVRALAAQLRQLNDRTWQADEAMIEQWRRKGAEHGAPLEISAQFGFAIFDTLVRSALEHQLPMKLDY
jgi:hypothetical protein